MEIVGASLEFTYLISRGAEDISLILFWPMIEPGTAIIAACLPSMTPLFGQGLFQRLRNSIRSLFSKPSRASRTWPYKSGDIEGHSEQVSSLEHLAKIGDTSAVNTYALRNLGPHDPHKISDEGIRVQHSFIVEEHTF